MAKKKKPKDGETKSFQYSVELTGLILILIGLIGFGFGPVGSIIKKFAMFLVGEWWPLILMITLILGVYMIAKRKLPKFFSSKLIGFYILFIVILVFSHFSFIKESHSSKEIFEATINNFMDRVSTMGSSGGIISSGQTNIVIGGGVIGAAFSFLLSILFDMTGTIIVLTILTIFGLIMLFDITLANVFEKVKSFFSLFKPKKKEKKLKTEEDDEDEEEDDKVVITSVEDLYSKPQEENTETTLSNAYTLPSLDILESSSKSSKLNSTEFIKVNKLNLERVLNDFQIKGTVVEIHIGPAVTQYELSIPAGTKVNRIVGIQKEISLALAAKDVRIQAPIPGKNTIGVEIPNPVVAPVKLKDILEVVYEKPKRFEDYEVLVALGKDIMGRAQVADLSKMPHLLVAGSTGSGKSVCINSFIASILMRYRPDEVKLLLVDPKKVELSHYNGVPHLIGPVVTDPKKANVALQNVVRKMEERYDIFDEVGAKNIKGYNEIIERENRKNGTNKEKMPYIVVILDELADLMLIAAKEVEDSIMRITQMARAAGIHLIVATQRPSTDVITGVVKANIPSRISFAVSSSIDSRTILDMMGAEKLLGKGDMLYRPMGENAPIRIQGSFITDDEIKRLINYVCKEQVSSYDESIMQMPEDNHMAGFNEKETYDDPLYNQIVDFAIQTGKISASLIQRRFRLGYNRAARIVDLLEERGIVGPQNGSKPREVLVKLEKKDDDEE